MEVTTDAVQTVRPAPATTTDFPVERFMRDAKITQIYEGHQSDSARGDVTRLAALSRLP